MVLHIEFILTGHGSSHSIVALCVAEACEEVVDSRKHSCWPQLKSCFGWYALSPTLSTFQGLKDSMSNPCWVFLPHKAPKFEVAP
jgi:hypothetical protein